MKITANREARNRLIFALDVAGGLPEVLRWIDLLQDKVGVFKVGKELFTRFGPEIVMMIRERGARVFLDLKFHDIPNTVARAVEAALEKDIFMFNVHALGGRRMIQAAAEALEKNVRGVGAQKPILLAVTVLTSLDREDLQEIGFSRSPEELAGDLARLAKQAGAQGVVASARDIAKIREICGKDFVILTPGIRGAAKIAGDDQKRVLSAEEAIGLGADYLVVGRPISEAADPVSQADEFLEAIGCGLVKRGLPPA